MDDIRNVYRGSRFRPRFTLKDADGNVVSLAVAGRRIVLRLTPVAESAPTVTRDTAVVAEVTWDVQTSGTGRFVITRAQTLALTVGDYYVDVWYYDSDTLDAQPVWPEAADIPVIWRVLDPITGAA